MSNIPKKNIIIITICISLAFLFTMFGMTFAYFSATITGNATNNNVSVTTETYGINVTYKTGSSTISLLNQSLKKGETSPTTSLMFQVTSTSNIARAINIELQGVSNTFCQTVADYNATTCGTNAAQNVASEVSYDLLSCTDSNYSSCTTKVSTGAFPTANQIIGSGLSIAQKGTNYYKLTVTLKNEEHLQNYNQGKSLSAKVIVSEKI